MQQWKDENNPSINKKNSKTLQEHSSSTRLNADHIQTGDGQRNISSPNPSLRHNDFITFVCKFDSCCITFQLNNLLITCHNTLTYVK